MRRKTGSVDLDAIDGALDKALVEALRESPDVQTAAKVARRRWFGLGLLIVSVFCLVVAALPWPNKQATDMLIWAGFAIVTLLVGAWQIDKASRDEANACRLANELPTCTSDRSDSGNVRRIK